MTTIERNYHEEYLKYDDDKRLTIEEFAEHSNNFYIYFWMKDGEIFPVYAKDEFYQKYLDEYPEDFARVCSIVTEKIDNEQDCRRHETIKQLKDVLYPEYLKMRFFEKQNRKLFH